MVGPSWQQVCAMGYEIPGVGVIPGDVVAGICERFDTRIRRVLLDPASGTTVETGAAGYTPSPAVRRFVTHRDGHCRAPGCARAARFCDLDHVIPWPLGPTDPSNLLTLCRRHHRMKHTDELVGGDGRRRGVHLDRPVRPAVRHPPGQPPRHPRRLMPTSLVWTGTARSRRAVRLRGPWPPELPGALRGAPRARGHQRAACRELYRRVQRKTRACRLCPALLRQGSQWWEVDGRHEHRPVGSSQMIHLRRRRPHSLVLRRRDSPSPGRRWASRRRRAGRRASGGGRPPRRTTLT